MQPRVADLPFTCPIPDIIFEDSSFRMWHTLDTSFGIPKVHLRFHLSSPYVYSQPASWMTTRLWVQIVNDVILPEAYHAQIAG